jgi:hypothetical protein
VDAIKVANRAAKVDTLEDLQASLKEMSRIRPEALRGEVFIKEPVCQLMEKLRLLPANSPVNSPKGLDLLLRGIGHIHPEMRTEFPAQLMQWINAQPGYSNIHCLQGLQLLLPVVSSMRPDLRDQSLGQLMSRIFTLAPNDRQEALQAIETAARQIPEREEGTSELHLQIGALHVAHRASQVNTLEGLQASLEEIGAIDRPALRSEPLRQLMLRIHVLPENHQAQALDDTSAAMAQVPEGSLPWWETFRQYEPLPGVTVGFHDHPVRVAVKAGENVMLAAMYFPDREIPGYVFTSHNERSYSVESLVDQGFSAGRVARHFGITTESALAAMEEKMWALRGTDELRQFIRENLRMEEEEMAARWDVSSSFSHILFRRLRA